jgi:hypothetical protein
LRFGVSAYSIVSISLGLVLLVAAALKGHQLITGYVPGRTLLTSRFIQILTVEAEFGLGIWLISGFHRRFAGCIAMAYFILLAGASAYLLTIGEECCGYLGRLAVSPWFTFVFNLAAISCLWVFPPVGAAITFSSRPWRATAAVSAFCFLGTYLLVAMPQYRVASSVDSDLGGDGEMVVLDVENWKGRQFPVLDFIDIGERLNTGRWLVILYHADCPRCEEVIKGLEEAGNDGDLKVTLIEVPLFSGFAEGPRLGTNKTFLLGKLAPTKRWLIVTPVLLRLEEGVVTGIQRETYTAMPGIDSP